MACLYVSSIVKLTENINTCGAIEAPGATRAHSVLMQALQSCLLYALPLTKP